MFSLNYGQIQNCEWKDTALCLNRYRFVCDHIKYINTYAYTNTSLLVVRFRHIHAIEFRPYILLNVYIQVVIEIHMNLETDLSVWLDPYLYVAEYRPIDVCIEIYIHSFKVCAQIHACKRR